MMRRRASPSARTIRTAPTAPCVPVDRDGARCASLGPTGCGASHRERLLHERGRWIGA